MNLNQLLADIENNPNVILVEPLPKEDYGSYLFIRVTSSVEKDVAQQQAVCIILKDRNTPDETAYVKGGLPANLKTTFRTEVTSAINAYQTTHSEMEFFKIVSIDNTNEIAKIIAYEYDNTKNAVTETPYIAYKVNNNLRFRKVSP